MNGGMADSDSLLGRMSVSLLRRGRIDLRPGGLIVWRIDPLAESTYRSTFFPGQVETRDSFPLILLSIPDRLNTFCFYLWCSTRRPRCKIAESRYVIHVNSDFPLSERRAPSQAYARLPGWVAKTTRAFCWLRQRVNFDAKNPPAKGPSLVGSVKKLAA